VLGGGGVRRALGRNLLRLLQSCLNHHNAFARAFMDQHDWSTVARIWNVVVGASGSGKSVVHAWSAAEVYIKHD